VLYISLSFFLGCSFLSRLVAVSSGLFVDCRLALASSRVQLVSLCRYSFGTLADDKPVDA